MKTALLLLFALLAASARAQSVISHLGTMATNQTDWTQTLSLPGFNAAMGTLTLVKLTFSGTAFESISLENLDNVTRGFSASHTVQLQLSRVGGPTLLTLSDTLAQSGSLGAFDGHMDFAGGSGTALSRTTPLSSLIFDSNLAQYLSTGMLSFRVTATGTDSLTSAGNLLSETIGQTDASLLVQYTYTPIPEPSVVACWLGLGAIGACLTRRGSRAAVRLG